MEPWRKELWRSLKDPLFGGFFLLTLLLLGVGLEQSLLHLSTIKHEIAFLTGNLLGLFLGFFFWQNPWRIIPLQLASKIWFLEGLLVGLLVWKQSLPLLFGLGFFFGFLILQLFILGRDYSFEKKISLVGKALIGGNLVLYLLKYIDSRVSLIILALFLAGWHIRVPRKTSFYGSQSLSFSMWQRFLPFWLFLFCFYVLGGFYYHSLLNLHVPSYSYFSLFSLFSYIFGVFLVLYFEKNLFKFVPILILMIMGFSLVLRLSSNLLFASFFTMEFGFGFLDLFALAYLFHYSYTLPEGVIGLSIFPISIFLSSFAFYRFGSSLVKYQWCFSALFLATMPALFCFRYLSEVEAKEKIKALPSKAPSSPPSGQQEKKGDSPLDKEFEELLSQREKEIFLLLLKDYKLKEIAEELHLALGTVKAFCNRIYDKLGVNGKQELCQKFRNSSPTSRES